MTLARPTTATTSHSSRHQSIKDTIQRHFSSDPNKGRAHFGSRNLAKSESHRDIRDSVKEGSGHHFFQQPQQQPSENPHDDGAESDPENTRRKSVLLLGKKVLNRLG